MSNSGLLSEPGHCHEMYCNIKSPQSRKPKQLSWLQKSDRSLSGWLPAISGVLVFFGFLQTCFHMIQVSFQHTFLGLQQGFHLHLWYNHIHDDN